MFNWKDKQDGVDDVLAEDINNIAHAVIDLQKNDKDNTIDQTFNPESENAQSGKAVNEAVWASEQRMHNEIIQVTGLYSNDIASLQMADILIKERLANLENQGGGTNDSGIKKLLPNDFKDAPIEVYKNGNNYETYHNFEQYKYDVSVYVDFENGSDTSGDGSKEKPYKTINKAVKNITADTNIFVKAQSPFFRGETTPAGFGVGYNVSFYNDNENKKQIVLTSAQRSLVWTKVDNVFSTTRSTTKNILYKDSNDTTFGWRILPQVNTLDDCKATVGSCFIDGSTVYINTFDGLAPTDEKYLVCITSGEGQFYPQDNTTMFFEGFSFVGVRGFDGVLFTKTTSGQASAKVVLKDCIAGQNHGYNDGATYLGNGFAFDNIKDVYLFNCIAKNCRRDGFNYHWSNATNAEECLVVEIDCSAINCGINDTTDNNNLTSCHNGAKCLRVNFYGRNSKGPMVADVNGCNSLLFGCDIAKTTIAYSYLFELANIGSAMLVDCKADNKKANATDGILYVDNFEGEIENGTTVINI